jgi:hypothetical protein
MKVKHLVFIGLALVSLLGLTTASLAGLAERRQAANATDTLIETVREATKPFQDPSAAEEAGYGLFHGCVSGPQEGAMGVHFANGALVGDGALDATRPEALLYEYRKGRLHLVGVEYVVLADAWHSDNEAPPVLMGQLFNYVSSPNRYGLPPFYELHVWAWKRNPLGDFADWNSRVSCAAYTAENAHGH